MERGSVQHGARLDDALAEGNELPLRGGGMTEREDLQPELPGEGETSDVRAPHDPEASNGPDPDELRDRSEMARWLLPSRFPADAATLVMAARSAGAPDDVISTLELLPPDVHYEAFGEVWRALGGEVEARAAESEVAPDTERLGEAVAQAVTEVAEEVAGDASPPIEPLEDEAVVEGGALVDEEHSSVPAQVGGLTVAVVDLALVPVRVGLSIIGRVLHRGRSDPD